MAPKRASQYTPIHMRDWEAIRQSEDASALVNPKTGARITRDGPKFQELENAFAKFKAKQATLVPEPEKAAASRDKIRDVLAAVIHESANRDPRTAAKLGMLTKGLREDYQRAVRPDGPTRPKDFFDTAIARELLFDAMDNYNKKNRQHMTKYRLVEPSDSLKQNIATALNRRMALAREASRAQAVSKLVKPTDVPRTEETLQKVWQNFKRKYDEGRYRSYLKRMMIDGLEELGDQNEADLSPLYKSVMNRIYAYYDVTKEIAVFYTQFVMVYMYRIVRDAVSNYVSRNYQQMMQGNLTNGAHNIELLTSDFRSL